VLYFQQMRTLRTLKPKFLYARRIEKFCFEQRKVRNYARVSLASLVNKRNEISLSATRENYSTRKLSLSPMASRPVSNALQRSTSQRRRSERDDLACSVATLVETSQRHQNARDYLSIARTQPKDIATLTGGNSLTLA
jgi:hypothetical protein